MRSSLVIFLLALVAVSAYPRDNNRIVGGSTTTIYQYPDNAALLFSWGTTGHRQLCGGTLINNRSILTAAHCVFGDAAARWQVRLGSTFASQGGVIYTTAFILTHPYYNPRILDNDVAILRVQFTIFFTNAIRPALFAGPNYNVPDNQSVWATGWGRLYSAGPSSDVLRHVQIYTVNQNICRQNYAYIHLLVTDNMLCSGVMNIGGRDQCFGDSGSPLYHNGVVVGVRSFGPHGLCADPRWPGVNARVQRFASWISQNS